MPEALCLPGIDPAQLEAPGENPVLWRLQPPATRLLLRGGEPLLAAALRTAGLAPAEGVGAVLTLTSADGDVLTVTLPNGDPGLGTVQPINNGAGLQIAVPENDEKLPLIVEAALEHRPFGEHSIQQKHDRKPWKVLFQLLRKPMEGFGLAILLGGIFTGVFYELRTNGDGESIRGD